MERKHKEADNVYGTIKLLHGIKMYVNRFAGFPKLIMPEELHQNRNTVLKVVHKFFMSFWNE